MIPDMKREVVCMEQSIAILKEYANEILTIYGGCMGILLLVTLHRIKRIEKQMRELLKYVAIKTDVPVQNICTTDLAQENRETDKNMPKKQETEQAFHEVKEHPEELIDAVLGEVF